MRNTLSRLGALLLLTIGCAQLEPIDLLILNGRVLDGTGNPWTYQDIGVNGDAIVFMGRAELADLRARDTIDATGLMVTPGFWDVHSHANLSSDNGKLAVPQLYQGITTVVLGVDGRGTSEVAEVFDGYRQNGIAVNAIHYVGHGSARQSVMGLVDRAPTPDELEEMKAFVRRGMEQGAAGLSTGLYYSPGTFATTEEVIELARVAASFGGTYDTHDRDLGVAYQGVGYLGSIGEAIRIAEEANLPAIFSHFNAQGPANYGRAVEGARLINEARARGVNVMAGQHVYNASGCSLVACVLPRWAAEGGNDSMRTRVQDPSLRSRLLQEVGEMLVMVGGGAKLQFTDRREHLYGRTVADVAAEWSLSEPETVLRILADGNASVLNHDIYDPNNTDLLAQQPWMMTCTDGGTPSFGSGIVHPRTYGAFPRKLREFVYDRPIIELSFAIRGMTSLPALFYGIPKRGTLAEGYYADITIFDEDKIRDLATYEEPHQYSEGIVHVVVNGQVAFRDGAPTDLLGGRGLRKRNEEEEGGRGKG